MKFNPIKPPQNRWRPLLMVCAVLLTWSVALTPQMAQAQVDTPGQHRLEVRGHEVNEETEDVTLFVSALNAEKTAVSKIDLNTFGLVSEDGKEPIAWTDPQAQLLKESTKNVAVLFVIADYRAFNKSNSSARAAAQEFMEKMRPKDVAGVLMYADSVRKLPFTEDTKALAAQLGKTKDEMEEASPQFLDALYGATHWFRDAPDEFDVQQRYMVIISDGSDTWANNKDQKALASKMDRFARRLKEQKITPIIIGHAPLMGSDEPGLEILRQLAPRANGTLRIVDRTDKTGVSDAAHDAYHEIYHSHVISFQSEALTPEMSHTIRLTGTLDGQELESQPISVAIPARSGINMFWVFVGLAIFMALGLFTALLRRP